MMTEKIMKTVVAAAACLSIGCGSLVACNDPKPTASPEHVSAVAADCTTDGNIEYWKKDGKFYSDEACYFEIDEIATVIDALDHDFESGEYVKDYTGHWKICARENCEAASAKVEHTGGECVCGFVSEAPAPVTEYAITVTQAAGGTVAASADKAAEGDTVTLAVTPDDGYILKTLAYNDTAIDVESAPYTFVMPAAAVTVTVEFEQLPAHAVVHYPAVEPACESVGNIEYWKKDGVNYSDADCTQVADTVEIPALGHDFEHGEYGKDGAEHWKICGRDGCAEESEHKAHVFAANVTANGDKEKIHTAATACECGRANAFAGYTMYEHIKDDATEFLGVTRADTADGLRVAATAPDNESWHIKLASTLDNVKVGRYYEITYKINSNVAGTVRFEADNGAYYNREAQIAVGENTVTFRFAVGSTYDGSKANVNLQFGALPAFEVQLTEPASVRELSSDMSGYWLDVDEITATKTDNADGTFTVNATGNGDGWRLKIASDLDLAAGKKYEIVYVFVRDGSNGPINEKNITYTIYDNKATIDHNMYWLDADAGNMHVATFTFTAEETCRIGSCLEVGELTTAEKPVSLTFTYIALREVQ